MEVARMIVSVVKFHTLLQGSMFRRALTKSTQSSLRARSSVTVPSVSPATSSTFKQSTLVFVGANLLGFGVSAATGSHYHLDLIGTGAFAVAAAASKTSGIRHIISAACVGLWSSRLALFLFYRVLQTKHDARLDDTLSTIPGAAGFWIISAAWGIICSLPHTLASKAPFRVRNKFDFCCAAGLAMFAAGFGIESVADYQKWEFKQQPENRGDFCGVGLWSLSQHPNYFGNLLLWSGILLMNAPCLVTKPHMLLLAAFSPVFMFGLFYGQASGKISNSKELMDSKYGSNPSFQTYVNDVPVLFPRVF
jgi:steroid 5-alpha reductase family enzyme